MSKKNYTNYSKPNRPVEEQPVVAPAEAEVIVDDLLEPDTTEKTLDEEPVAAEPVYGFVTGCAKLRVRADASTNAEVLDELSKDTRVTITDTVGDWYAVTVNDGLEGFCMKKFIVINQ